MSNLYFAPAYSMRSLVLASRMVCHCMLPVRRRRFASGYQFRNSRTSAAFRGGMPPFIRILVS